MASLKRRAIMTDPRTTYIRQRFALARSLGYDNDDATRIANSNEPILARVHPKAEMIDQKNGAENDGANPVLDQTTDQTTAPVTPPPVKEPVYTEQELKEMPWPQVRGLAEKKAPAGKTIQSRKEAIALILGQ